MSAAFADDHRDLRSASILSKRDKEHIQKWSNGARGMSGASYDDIVEEAQGDLGRVEKIRPFGQWAYTPKPSYNKAPKPYATGKYSQMGHAGSVARKVHAVIDANEHTTSPLSKSLLDILPQHANNTDSAIRTAIRESASAVDADILYSFDNKGPSPGTNGRDIDLSGLVDLAEKKWANDQVEKLVKGEYEVLDDQGETTVLKKGKRSPKQKAVKISPAVPKVVHDTEDDGFELI